MFDERLGVLTDGAARQATRYVIEVPRALRPGTNVNRAGLGRRAAAPPRGWRSLIRQLVAIRVFIRTSASTTSRLVCYEGRDIYFVANSS